MMEGMTFKRTRVRIRSIMATATREGESSIVRGRRDLPWGGGARPTKLELRVLAGPTRGDERAWPGFRLMALTGC
jgi:hypothetical protein